MSTPSAGFSPSLWNAIFRQAPIGAYLLTPTAEAVVLEVNDAFLSHAGRRREEMVGRSLFEAFPADPDDPTDTGESALRASILRAVATGTPQVMPAQRYPIAVTTAEGATVFEERFWNATNTPIADETGAIVCVLHVTQDVTEQVRAETALRRSEREAQAEAARAEAERRRLDAVVDAVPVGIALTDARGRITLANATYRRHWGPQHPWPQSVEDYGVWHGWWADGSERHGQRLAARDWPAARLLRGERATRDIVEVEAFDPPGERRIVLFTGAPVTDGEGGIAGAVVAQLDITDRFRAEEALRRADRRKDEFLAMLSHELRNPLAPIGAAADVLALGTLDAEGVRRTSDIIARQVRHMTGLVDDLLDVSRVTRGLITLEQERVEMKRLITEALEQTRPLIEARRHDVTVQMPAEPAIVCGDSKRLVQVIANLLTNAAKYTPPGGRIAIELSLCRDHVEVAVADNGIGMPPELVEHAFELFAQAERTADRAQGGLGIGLALVKRLMELHGGSVHASSAGPGQGSRFTLRLPQLEPAETPAPVRDRPTVETGAGGLNVLVVDDNADAATMLALLIRTLGHRTAIENAPHPALERARAERPDVCVLDMGLPELDGAELARRLRRAPETADALLIAVSGYGQPQDREEALAAGFDHYFVKPADSAQLAAVLAERARRCDMA